MIVEEVNNVAITVKDQNQERQVGAASLASQKSIRKYAFLSCIHQKRCQISVVVVKYLIDLIQLEQ